MMGKDEGRGLDTSTRQEETVPADDSVCFLVPQGTLHLTSKGSGLSCVSHAEEWLSCRL